MPPLEVVKGNVYVVDPNGMLYVVNAQDGVERWHLESIFAPPVLDEKAYVGDSKTLRSVNVNDGSEQWHFALMAPETQVNYPTPRVPMVVDGTVYAGGDSLYAIDAIEGTEKWRLTTGHDFYSPLVVDDVVYVRGGKHLYAVDAPSGEELWQYAPEEGLGYSLLVDEGIVYVDSLKIDLHAVDATDGTERWRFTNPGDDHAFLTGSSLNVEDGVVYFGINHEVRAGTLYALGADDGTEMWTFATTGLSSLPVVDGMIYVGDQNGMLTALDLKDGSEVWKFATDDGYGIFPTPRLVDGVVYCGYSGNADEGDNSSNLYAVDAKGGTERWRFAFDSYIASTPSVADGVVFVATQDGKIQALYASA